MTTIFSEPDGEEMTYTASVVTNVNNWLEISNTTNKIYGTSPQVGDQDRSFYMYAHDPKFGNIYMVIYLRIRMNDRPTLLTSIPYLY